MCVCDWSLHLKSCKSLWSDFNMFYSFSVRRPSRQNSAFQEETVFGPSTPPPAPAAPPPPPPPAATPVDSAPPSYSSATSGRGALLSDIKLGTKLKRTVTNDRSAPRVWPSGVSAMEGNAWTLVSRVFLHLHVIVCFFFLKFTIACVNFGFGIYRAQDSQVWSMETLSVTVHISTTSFINMYGFIFNL